MSSKRKDSFSEAIVGVFMLAVLALLVYFTIVVSGVDVFGGRSMVEARVTFTDVGGLKEQDNVMYRGTKAWSESSETHTNVPQDVSASRIHRVIAIYLKA